MKSNYDVFSAKAMVTRNKGRFEGKMILIENPGIKTLGAIDYLLEHGGYGWNKTPSKKKKREES